MHACSSDRGSGYIGSHAVRELAARGHEVVIYDDLSTGHRQLSRGFELIEGNIADVAKLATVMERVDAVMHFAASAYVGESVMNPRKYFQNNVERSLKLLDAVMASAVRVFIFSSTCATYGAPQRLPIREDDPKEPINPYGATKLFGEHVLSAYAASDKLRYVALRYFNAAGVDESGCIGEYHDPETHLIPLAMRAILQTAPPLKVFGRDFDTPDGTCIRDYVHVCDLAAAHVLALEYLAAGGDSVSLNLATGRGTSIAELLDKLRQITGEEVPHVWAEARAGDPPVLYADPARSREVLGWEAKRDLNQILTSAWNWERRVTRLGLAGATVPER